MKRILLLLITLALLLSLLASCVQVGQQQLTVAELLDLGEKYLLETNYEQAIVQFLRVIEISPKEHHVYALIGNSYIALKEYKSASVYYNIASAVLPNEEVYNGLFASQILLGDLAALQRSMEDLQRTGKLYAGYFETAINMLFTADSEYDSQQLAELAETLRSLDVPAAVPLAILIWQALIEEDADSLRAILLSNDAMLPILDDDELYIGAYNDQGERHGFGICFYGSGAKKNSRLYIGNWESNLRSGEGTAYAAGDNYLICAWSNDWPNGAAELFGRRGWYVTYGSYFNGHAITPMESFDEDGEWIETHCIADDSYSNGYKWTRPSSDGDCPCVTSHLYCWDCGEEDLEGEGVI
jgi:tetratricopeptide (TPR) repeat protein